MSKHLQFWSAISQCGSARHAINRIHYTQFTEAKLDIEPEHIISIFLLMIILFAITWLVTSVCSDSLADQSKVCSDKVKKWLENVRPLFQALLCDFSVTDHYVLQYNIVHVLDCPHVCIRFCPLSPSSDHWVTELVQSKQVTCWLPRFVSIDTYIHVHMGRDSNEEGRKWKWKWGRREKEEEGGGEGWRKREGCLVGWRTEKLREEGKYMWQSWIEIEYYSVTYFEHIAKFDVL